MGDILGDPELTKLFDAYIAVKKAGRGKNLEKFGDKEQVRFRNPSKEKLLCAIEGDEGELEEAIDVIQNYGNSTKTEEI